MSRKHKLISQLDGNESLELIEDDENEAYDGSKHYWKNGYLGGAWQSYIDALEVLENCGFESKTKETEKEKLLNARKEALGDVFKYYPPWST